ncbi:glycosyltransferase family protein [Leifsonia poae]|uniref:glycosyltransferase family protein n=1 Tax=Leifsonia poae TaxID=110933 RepID=UPI003D6779CD
MTRSVLFVDSYYSAVLHTLGLDVVPDKGFDYRAKLDELLDFGFGTGAAYARNFARLGWETNIVIPNSLSLQTQWARDHGLRDPLGKGWAYGAHLSRLPVARDHLHRVRHLHSVLLEQARQLQPDAIVVQDLNLVPPGFAKALRRHTRLLIGEIASPLPPKPFLTGYDHIVSALPSIVETASSWGIPATGIPLAFDERWATRSPASTRPIDAIFIGSFSRLQPTTAPLLRAVAEQVPGLKIYGSVTPDVLAEHGLTQNYVGPAWGAEMFRLLGEAKMVINRHGSIAGDYAVNMRMFETTGSGAALITENKSNLATLFEPETEVLAYDSPEQAAELAAGLVADPARLDRIAAAGQAKTLRAHTYAHRARTLGELIEASFGGRRP